MSAGNDYAIPVRQVQRCHVERHAGEAVAERLGRYVADAVSLSGTTVPATAGTVGEGSMAMAIQHAPYALFGDLVLAYGKTTKTACGKRIRTDRLATRDDATCPDCRRVIADDRAKIAETRAIAENILRAHGCPDCGAPFDNLTAWNSHRLAQHKLSKHGL